ncbi:scavenger receptor cysteine-rich domain-containing group B protein-like [Diadema antillarum]|uniref:scavenger receptor cysteine-rich domain-containing group B protein-like n=1 Tax=Diadema antillarum TaxID=105358 RepID=UPI003A892487
MFELFIGVPAGAEDVRLVDGSGSYEGRVEVLYDSQWGTVCHNYWDIMDASVVCKQLGFANATDSFRYAYFGGGSPDQPIYLDDVRCSGNETELTDCEYRGWDVKGCIHYYDAGLHFNESQNLPSLWRIRNQKQTPCLSDCFGSDKFPIFVEDVALSSAHPEERMYDTGDVRLTDGPTSRDGRLEIYHNNEWGTVCNTTWGPEEAEVTCRQLGNDGVNNVYYSPTPGNGSVHLSRVDCTGSETELLDCNVTFSDDSYTPCADVGVDCFTLLTDSSGKF